MRIQIYTALLFVGSFALRLQAQQFTSPKPLTTSVFVKNDYMKNGNDSFQNIQLRISHMSNRMV